MVFRAAANCLWDKTSTPPSESNAVIPARILPLKIS